LEFADSVAVLEVVAHLTEGEVSHTAAKRIAHDVALVDDSLALEVAFLGISDGFLRALGRVGHSVLFLRIGSFVRLGDNAIGLIAELRGELAVSFHNLGWA
jgi:hypothetical protein